MVFPARYRGECSDCDVPIEPGDNICMTGDGVAHVVCLMRRIDGFPRAAHVVFLGPKQCVGSSILRERATDDRG